MPLSGGMMGGDALPWLRGWLVALPALRNDQRRKKAKIVYDIYLNTRISSIRGMQYNPQYLLGSPLTTDSSFYSLITMPQTDCSLTYKRLRTLAKDSLSPASTDRNLLLYYS